MKRTTSRLLPRVAPHWIFVGCTSVLLNLNPIPFILNSRVIHELSSLRRAKEQILFGFKLKAAERKYCSPHQSRHCRIVVIDANTIATEPIKLTA